MNAVTQQKGASLGGYPIPAEALDDRLGWVGTAGGGKTYNAGVGVERLLAAKARVIILDPLDVWWGLRLREDGKTPSVFAPVIFGGPHGDLPLNERSGALLGETAATMRESCIISLADFRSSASERRFMLDFLTALDRNANREPVHLVFDEADLWAPQLVLDKDGDAMKLLGQMQAIVRRGRIKGFIPWLITQRPAAISKGVLSQIDGMVAFKLTSSQDREAIGGWIKGQADAEAGKAILASLPSMQQGQGVVWVPGRGILVTEQFPAKVTFDSSRTPKRGEVKRTATLKPLDLGALKGRLAAVEEEAKANDPKLLKAEIARLQRELREAPKGKIEERLIAPAEVQEATALAYKNGKHGGFLEGVEEGEKRGNVAGQALMLTRVRNALDALRVDPAPAAEPPLFISAPTIEAAKMNTAPRPTPPPAAPRPALDVTDAPSAPIRKVLDAIAWWNAFGLAGPSANQVGFIAGYSPTGGTFKRYRGEARTRGLITYPSDGRLALTDAGAALAMSPDAPPTVQGLHEAVCTNLDAPLVKLLRPLLDAYPECLSAELVGEVTGYEASGGTFKRYRGQLKTLEIIDYPSAGLLRAADWLFPGETA